MIVSHVPFRAVLWDFDGVLNLNAAQGRFLWSDGFEDRFAAPLDDFAETVFGTLESVLTGKEDIRDRIARWIDRSGADTTPDDVLAHWLDHDFHPNKRLLPIIARLGTQGMRQAVLTNSDLRRAEWLDGLMARLPEIERVFVSARIGHAKPAPEAFAAVLDTMGLEAGEVLFVDDDTGNVNAAASLGFRTFRYSPLAHDALEWSLPR